MADDQSYGPGLDPRDFIDDMLKGLGYDKDPNAQAMKTFLAQRAEKDRAMAATIARLFATDDGEKVLDWLVATTLRRDQEPPFELMLSLRMDQVHQFTMYRAGENSVVKMIIAAIAQSKQKPSRRRKAL